MKPSYPQYKILCLLSKPDFCIIATGWSNTLYRLKGPNTFNTITGATFFVLLRNKWIAHVAGTYNPKTYMITDLGRDQCGEKNELLP